jgi:hypothetical protein
MRAIGNQLGSLVKNTLQTSVSLADNALSGSIKSIDAVQGAVNAGIQTTSGTATTAFRVVGDANSVAENASSEGSKVANESVTQAGKVAKETLSMAGAALHALIGTATNAAERRSQIVNNTKITTAALSGNASMLDLERTIVFDFKKRMAVFIARTKDCSRTQTAFISALLRNFKMSKCKQGVVYGFSCPQEASAAVAKFELQIELAKKKCVTRLNTLSSEAETAIFKLKKPKNATEYTANAFEVLDAYSERAAEAFTALMTEFEEIANLITAEAGQKGGRSRRKRRTRRRTKRRKYRV